MPTINNDKRPLEQQIQELLCKKMLYHLSAVAENTPSDSQAAVNIVNTLATTYATLFGTYSFSEQGSLLPTNASTEEAENEYIAQEYMTQDDDPLAEYQGLAAEDTIRRIEQKKLAGVELDAGEEDIYRILKLHA